VADIITLIHHSEFPSLKMFELKVQSEVLSLAEVERLFRALSRCNACQTLEVIVIRSYTLVVQERSGHPFTAVRHLFCFMHLQTLSLFILGSVLLDSDILLEVGRTSAVWTIRKM
jgi:hypothetical protein